MASGITRYQVTEDERGHRVPRGAAGAVRGAYLAGVPVPAGWACRSGIVLVRLGGDDAVAGRRAAGHLPRHAGAGRRAGRLPGARAWWSGPGPGRCWGWRSPSREPVRRRARRADVVDRRAAAVRRVLAAPAVRGAALPVGGVRLLRRRSRFWTTGWSLLTYPLWRVGVPGATSGQPRPPGVRGRRTATVWYLDSPFEIAGDLAGRAAARAGHAVDDPRAGRRWTG